MELFYAHPGNIDSDFLSLDDFETRHIRNTLRKRPGDMIVVGDGLGKRYHAEITALKPQITCRIQRTEIQPAPPGFGLALGFIRPNRLEWILEKATELGVTDFLLVRTHRSTYFSDNAERFDKIARQAMKQSLRFYKPAVHLLPDFRSFLEQSANYPWRAAAIDETCPPLADLQLEPGSPVLMSVGPEGGFDEDETAAFRESGFHTVSLGSNRLRAETAALAACSWLMLKR